MGWPKLSSIRKTALKQLAKRADKHLGNQNNELYNLADSLTSEQAKELTNLAMNRDVKGIGKFVSNLSGAQKETIQAAFKKVPGGTNQQSKQDNSESKEEKENENSTNFFLDLLLQLLKQHQRQQVQLNQQFLQDLRREVDAASKPAPAPKAETSATPAKAGAKNADNKLDLNTEKGKSEFSNNIDQMLARHSQQRQEQKQGHVKSLNEKIATKLPEVDAAKRPEVAKNIAEVIHNQPDTKLDAIKDRPIDSDAAKSWWKESKQELQKKSGLNDSQLETIKPDIYQQAQERANLAADQRNEIAAEVANVDPAQQPAAKELIAKKEAEQKQKEAEQKQTTENLAKFNKDHPPETKPTGLARTVDNPDEKSAAAKTPGAPTPGEKRSASTDDVPINTAPNQTGTNPQTTPAAIAPGTTAPNAGAPPVGKGFTQGEADHPTIAATPAQPNPAENRKPEGVQATTTVTPGGSNHTQPESLADAQKQWREWQKQAAESKPAAESTASAGQRASGTPQAGDNAPTQGTSSPTGTTVDTQTPQATSDPSTTARAKAIGGGSKLQPTISATKAGPNPSGESPLTVSPRAASMTSATPITRSSQENLDKATKASSMAAESRPTPSPDTSPSPSPSSSPAATESKAAAPPPSGPSM